MARISYFSLGVSRTAEASVYNSVCGTAKQYIEGGRTCIRGAMCLGTAFGKVQKKRERAESIHSSTLEKRRDHKSSTVPRPRRSRLYEPVIFF